jgi:hypothetical protein
VVPLCIDSATNLNEVLHSDAHPKRLNGWCGCSPPRRPNGESALAFFRRLEASRLKLLLNDLETLTSTTARPGDYVDLAETTPFSPETSDGECAT